MRFLPVVAVLVLALASPAVAQQKDITKSMGSANCATAVPCPSLGSASMVSNAALASIANTCVADRLGYPAGSYFDATTDLDGNNCLTPIPGALPQKLGVSATVSCCVLPYPGTTQACLMHCEATRQ